MASPEVLLKNEFSDYGTPVEKLPLFRDVIEGSRLVLSGYCDTERGCFLDVYSLDGDEYAVINN